MPSRYAPFVTVGVLTGGFLIMAVLRPVADGLPPEAGKLLVLAVAPIALGYYLRALVAAWGKTIVGMVQVYQEVAPSNPATLQSFNPASQEQDDDDKVPALGSGVVRAAAATGIMTRAELVTFVWEITSETGGGDYTAAIRAVDAACRLAGVTLPVQRGRYAPRRTWKLVVDSEPIPGMAGGKERSFERE